jgi:hypothetical protein
MYTVQPVSPSSKPKFGRLMGAEKAGVAERMNRTKSVVIAARVFMIYSPNSFSIYSV